MILGRVIMVSLVLVDKNLGVITMQRQSRYFYVLILVLVDHALGDGWCDAHRYGYNVLILVLVDHALGVIKDDNELSFTKKS